MRRVSWRFFAAAALLVATLTLSRLAERRRPQEIGRPLETIATEIDGWTPVPDPPLPDDVLMVLKPTSYLSSAYRKGGRELGLFVAFYARQRAGESMHSPKNCLPGEGWEIWKYGTAEVPFQGRPVKVNQYSIQKGSQRLLVLYWYQTKERVFASEYLGKILLVRDAILEGTTAGAIVRLTLPDDPGMLEDGLRFTTLWIPRMQACFGR